MKPTVYRFDIPEKFSDKQLDAFIREFFAAFKKEGVNAKYVFNLSELKWISNQNLLFIAALFKYLAVADIPFYVRFLPTTGVPMSDYRQARQFVQIWEMWKISQVAGTKSFDLYFDITDSYISRLKRDFDIEFQAQKVYDHYEITPLIILDKLYNYSDRTLLTRMDEVLALDAATHAILRLNNCSFPFENNTVHYIIVKELYENFLDHFSGGVFQTKDNFAFMSLALNQKLKGDSSNNELQGLLKTNFYSEYDPQFLDFFAEKKGKQFKNRSFLQFSFVDFGEGIPKTLRAEYRKYAAERGISNQATNEDSEIIQYAFRFDSSRHPLPEKYRKNSMIPRGLFDLLSIVKRYDGLILIRSGQGKVLFDFSSDRDIKSSVKYFEGHRNLPGTMITIFIPERDRLKRIDNSVITPVYNLPASAGRDRKEVTVNMFKLQKDFQRLGKNPDKEILYNYLFEKLEGIFRTKSFNILYTVDFSGYDIDERIAKKIIYFLISDYSINLHHNVIVVNPPPKEFLRQINFELQHLTEVDRKFRIHPTPFIYPDEKGDSVEIFWLGIYNANDLEKLKYIQSIEHGLSKGDFEKPEDIVGHINYYDEQGNLISVINSDLVYNRFLRLRLKAKQKFIQKYFDQLIDPPSKILYLMPQNFYQTEYLNPNTVFSDKPMCRYIADTLYLLMEHRLLSMSQVKILTLSKSAETIVDLLAEHNKDIKKKHIALTRSHHAINSTMLKKTFMKNDNIIIVCECVYSGALLKQIHSAMPTGATIRHVATFINTLTPKAMESHPVFKEMLYAYHRPIDKLSLESAQSMIIKDSYQVVRIDHRSGSTINHTFNDTNARTSNLLGGVDRFLSLVLDKHIKAGYFQFNNLVHPYFFDMEEILKDEHIRESLLTELFAAFEKTFPNVLPQIAAVYYPKNSAIKFIPHSDLKDRLFKNELLEITELDRQSTKDGWRYMHVFDSSSNSKKKIVMIFDDGCCSGESLIQMIDDLALLNISHIYILTIISRLTEHKREMFSRLRQIEGRYGVIKLNIVFGCHWYVPTYGLYESPISIEKAWLENVQRILNLPAGVRAVCKSVLSELEFKTILENNNKFLLKTKKGDPIVKELVLTKNEVGKMASYRLYQDYFDFFDHIIKVYLNEQKREVRYQPFELLCGVFLHEPYLYKPLKRVIPDVIEKIELFSSTLIIGNYNKEDSPILRKKKLIYEWSFKNTLHLFFIVYSDSRLFDFLTSTRMLDIVKRFGKSEKDLNYILYNLLKYIPITKEETANKPHAERVLSLIALCIDSPEIGDKPKRTLKRFRSFMLSLPYVYTSFEKLLNSISAHYLKLDDDANHKFSFSAQYDTLKMKLLAYELHGAQQALNEAQLAWELMSDVINTLLLFAASYPDFFGPVKNSLYRNIEYADRSLRGLFGYADDLFAHINPANAKDIMNAVEAIHDRFFISATECYKVFRSITTPNVKDSLTTLIVGIAGKVDHTGLFEYPKFDAKKIQPVAVPQYYIDNYLVPEIIANFRNADPKKDVIISWDEDNDYIIIRIQNYILNTTHKVGGGSGMEDILDSFDRIPGKLCEYKHYPSDDQFFQTIKFKKML